MWRVHGARRASQDLGQLPSLQHLSLPGLSWQQGPLQAEHLEQLAAMPSLTSLGERLPRGNAGRGRAAVMSSP